MARSRYLHPDSPWLLVLLAALVALGPLSIDMYLPAMPVMKDVFNTHISQVQLTMSSYLAGFAIFHLVCGPLSDRFGRKPILLGGTALFVAASIGCAQSSSIGELLLFRFIQGVGACVGPTLARATVRDLFGPVRAARALSLIAMLMALAPAVAPLLGGLALLVFPWSSIFFFLAAYGLLMMALIHLLLVESLPERQSLHPIAIARNFATLSRDRDYMAAVLTSCLVYAGMMTYVASSSFVFIDMYGVPREYFGLVFLTAVLGYMAGSAMSARLSSHYGSEQVLLTGVFVALGASLLALPAWWLLPGKVLALALPMGLYIVALGLVMPHAMTLALRGYPQMAGTASSLLGFIQMSFAATVTAIVGTLLQDTPTPMVLSILTGAFFSVPLGLYLYRQRPAAGH